MVCKSVTASGLSCRANNNPWGDSHALHLTDKAQRGEVTGGHTAVSHQSAKHLNPGHLALGYVLSSSVWGTQRVEAGTLGAVE